MVRYLALVLGAAVCSFAQDSYKYFLSGSDKDVHPKTKGGFVLAGGGKDDDASFRWLIERSGGGDIVILRASGGDTYHSYLAGLGKFDSVETIVFKSEKAAHDPFVIEKIRNAEAIFLAGGDQWNYVRYWKGTPVQEAVNDAIRRGVPVGGTSAGLAVLGEYGFSAEHDSVTSVEALKNPFDEKVTISRDFVRIPHLECLVTDTHFSKRERMGRLLVFMARIRDEGKCEQVRGLGVDERAVVLMEPDGSARVSGEGSAFFLRLSEAPRLQRGAAATIPPMEVVRVDSGNTFDLASWKGPKTDRYQISVENGEVRTTDPWANLRVFEGKWEGSVTGEPGKGTSTREYRFDLNGRFLHVRNKSVYVSGEVHEDLGLFSYDRSSKKIILRQFHGEGFVNEYSGDGKLLEFVTTRIENIPPGWQAKEAYRVVSKDEIVETFSLAPPGKDFAVYSETRLLRRPL